jgi:hypothetical protein
VNAIGGAAPREFIGELAASEGGPSRVRFALFVERPEWWRRFATCLNGVCIFALSAFVANGTHGTQA